MSGEQQYRNPEPSSLDQQRTTRDERRAILARCVATLARSMALVERARRQLEIAEELDQHFHARAQSGVDDRESAEVRQAVELYTRQLWAQGEPPQRALVMVKETAADAAKPYLLAHDADELLSDVVRWSIDAYFAAST
jgi:hypothetical protein